MPGKPLVALVLLSALLLAACQAQNGSDAKSDTDRIVSGGGIGGGGGGGY